MPHDAIDIRPLPVFMLNKQMVANIPLLFSLHNGIMYTWVLLFRSPNPLSSCSKRFPMKKLLPFLLILLFPITLHAQEVVDAPGGTPTAEAPTAEAPAAEAPAAEAPAPEVDNTKSNDPVDRVVAHLTQLNDIITKNMGNGEALLSAFKDYLDNNDKAMRMASKAFQEKLERLKVDEAEAYREVAQRKLTPVLDNLITLLLQLNDTDPDTAQKLDTMLKVDARYTYNP